MADFQSKRLRSFYAPLQTQDSTLLNIPSEIRNGIYDALCETATTVILRYRSKTRVVPLDHPLARTCRQLREEFLEVCESKAADHAATIVCAIKNIEIGDMAMLRQWLEDLPRLPQGTRRKSVLRFHISNDLERSLRQKRPQRHAVSEAAKKVKFDLTATFDPATLDVGNTERVLRGHDGGLSRRVLQLFQLAVACHKSKLAHQRNAKLQAIMPNDLDAETNS